LRDKEHIIEILAHSNLFLTGGAGVGKSYLTNEVIAHFRQQGKEVVALGSTGVSAVNIGGFTLHSFFLFGISDSFEKLQESDRGNRRRLKELERALGRIDLMVIDEISMVSATLLEMLVYRLTRFGYSGRVLLVGDFFQLPPVRKSTAENSDIFGQKHYAFESSAWEKLALEVVVLEEMKRTRDLEFTHILGRLREGVCDDEVIAYLAHLTHQPIKAQHPTYLYGRNLEVEQTNRERLNQLNTEETILFANLDTFGKVHEKRLASWKKALPIEEQLTLKVGAPVLFTVNKWGKFFNGERGVVVAIEEEYLVVEREEDFVRVERHAFDLLDMRVGEDGAMEQITLATLSQFPLKLAYAITIHKSQGMSIDHLVCSIDHIFAPSQFYVAISRAINPKHLRLETYRGDLADYLRRVVHVDRRVIDYYKAI
jgi:ATP-dependent DNA helicase PIF1